MNPRYDTRLWPLLALVLLVLVGCGAATPPRHTPGTQPETAQPLLVVTERVFNKGKTVPQVVAYQQRHQRWAVSLPAPGAALVTAAGVVYVCAGQTVLALDAQTGHQRWTTLASPQVRAISVIEGQVYVDTGGSFAGAERIIVFSLAGQLRWQYTPPALQDIPAWLVDGGVFYTVVSGFPASLVALDAQTGTERWHAPLQLDAPVRSLVPAGPTALLVVALDRLVVARRSDGAEIWRRDQTQAIAPQVQAGVVSAFFVDQPLTIGGEPQPVLRALRLTDGGLLWEQLLPESDAGFLMVQSPLTAGGISAEAAWLVDGADFTMVHVWNLADGRPRWTYLASARVSMLASDGEMLYLATASQLLALQSVNGKPRWQQPNPDNLTRLDEQASILLGKNPLTNTLALYDPQTGQRQWQLHPQVLDQALVVSPGHN